MKMRCSWLAAVVGLGVCLLGLAATGAAAAIEVSDLRCEYRVNPLGIDTAKPRLSWILKGEARGQKQTAYQVLVASDEAKLGEGQADLWDSGQVASDQSNQIEYQGKPLASQARCHWKVRVWDKDQQASAWSTPALWSMGLLEKSDWQAKWIGYDEAAAKEQFNLQGCKWVWYPEGDPHQSAPPGKVYFRRTLTIPSGRTIRSADFLLSADDEFLFYVNGKLASKHVGVKDGWKKPQTVALAKLLHEGENVLAIEAHNTGDKPTPAGVIGRLVVKFDAGEPLQIQVDKSWKTSKQVPEGWQQAHFHDSDWKAAKETVPLGHGPWTGMAGGSQPMLPAPHLRKTFALDKPIKRATLYATALGLYEVSINGKPVTTDVLVPGWSDYPKRVYYFAYDVTDLLTTGDNAIGAILGDGWYGSYLAFTGKRRFYGGAPRLMLQLSIEAADGSRQVVGTDESWKAGLGPIVYADLLMGEKYDAQQEIPGWDTPGFNDASWRPVNVSTDLKMAVERHPGLPIRAQETLPAKKQTEPKPGVYVYDLGQNMVGWVRLKLNGKAGQEVTVRHAEILNPDGTLYTTNLRAAKATDVYLLKDGEHVYEPRLTFHGFRYVELTGLASPPKAEDVVGVVVHSDIPRTCWFECSNPLVNKLVENTHWGQKGNYLDVPTDCPQRDERAGWTADAQVFTKTAAFNRDVSAFFTKWLVDLCRDGQRADGAYPDVAPSILGHGNAAWEDAGVICTYRQYEMYGDTRAVATYYPNLCRFMEHLEKSSKNGIRQPGNYGDWLLLAGPQHSPIHGTAYYYYCATLMAEMARAIGKTDDAARWTALAAKLRQVYIENFVHPDGTVCDAKKKTGQTFYALTLYFDLAPPELREKIAARLIDDLKARDWHLATGFIGTPLLLPTLEKIGRADVAYKILLNETYPSWLCQVKLGSTTMWERWDGWLPDKGFQNPGMNSFNHYWLGCVGEWLYTRVAGIDTVGPGFRQIVVRPRIGVGKDGLTSAKVRYDSIRGRIESGWKLEGGRLTLDVVIPANATATIYVPAADAAKVTEGGKPAAQSPGVKFLRTEGDAAVYEVGSGTYSFVAEPKP